MAVSHKNKTFASLLACVLGTIGAHRFYLGGLRDRWAWLHLSSVPLALLVTILAPDANWFYKIMPLTLSALVAFLESLVLGLMSDEKWDASYNTGSGRQSASNWPLALLLVATLMLGTGTLIATMARLFDLLYTGGAYG
jgi:TM2 domain-containing membrane protein YozV